jgi:hypothetical protein
MSFVPWFPLVGSAVRFRLIAPRALRLLLATGAVLCPGAAFAEAPVIALEEGAVAVSGVTASGRVAWMSIAFERVDLQAHLSRRDLVLDDEDGDGVVRVELEGGVPLSSLFAAVDMATGELAVATPEGSPFREVDFPGRGIGAELRTFEDRRRLLDLLLVRPGGGEDAGVWSLSLADGGPGDDDGRQDRSLRARTGDFRPVADSPPPPERLAPGDVLIGFDPETLELFSVRLPGGGA